MGHLSAIEMAGMPISLEQQLSWHLQSNHYPPVPTSMIQPCIEAIDALVMDEAFTMIDLPEGIEYRGSSQAPAWAIVEAHHLDPFVESCIADYIGADD